MKYRHNKIKKEHHMIDGALELLETLSELDVVTDIIPGVIEPARAREKGAVYQYETATGCKLILKGGGAVQEVFVVTEYPELVREWAALTGAKHGSPGETPSRSAPPRPRPGAGPIVEETELSSRPAELRGIPPEVKMVTISQKTRDAYVASLAGAGDGWAVEEIVPREQAEALRRRGTEAAPPFADSDRLIYARVRRADIQLFTKYLEGLGHMGIVTTVDKQAGKVLIQTTRSMWPELKKLIVALPLSVELMKDGEDR